MFRKSAMGVVACLAAAAAWGEPSGKAGPITRPASAAARAATRAPSAPVAAASAPHAAPAKPRLDTSGRTRVGKASVYAKRLDGRRMADGSPMDADGDSAASKTLPLGTTAKVTNLENGQSATVTIRDRGPYVKGRIVDLSPATADQVGIDHEKGVSRVAVTPLSVPSAAGSDTRVTRPVTPRGRPSPPRPAP